MRRPELRPVLRSDYDWLYLQMTSVDVGWRWRFRGATPSPEAFASALWREVLCQYVIVDGPTRKSLGFVQAYSADFRSRHAYLSVLIDPQLHRRGWPLLGVYDFVDHLFTRWDFNKLYMESLHFNVDSFRSGIGSIFEREGYLREHTRVHSTYVDSEILALYRRRWLEERHRFVSDDSFDEESGHSDGRARLDAAVKSVSSATLDALEPDTPLLAQLGLDSLGALELYLLLEDSLPLDLDLVGVSVSVLIGLLEQARPDAEGERSLARQQIEHGRSFHSE